MKGRNLGEKRCDTGEWNEALHECLRGAGIAEYAVVSQGSTIHRADGTEQYIRNFSSDYGFKNALLKGIVGVKRSPLTQRVVPNTKL